MLFHKEKIFLKFLRLMQTLLHFTRLSVLIGQNYLPSYLSGLRFKGNCLLSFAKMRNFIYYDEFCFRENLFFAKIVQTPWHHLTISVFAKELQVLQKNNFFRLPLTFSPIVYIFSEKCRETKKFCKSLRKKNIATKIFAKICLTLVSSKYFLKNGSFVLSFPFL